MMFKARVATKPPGSISLFTDARWWLFCLIVVTSKFLLLGFDPLPRLFLGDSGVYVWSALYGKIPADRSFLYGYLIRWSSLSTGSLTSLLVLQAFVSAITAIIVMFICRSIFGVSSRLPYLFGLLCAVDPLQLVWERYIMTETISLFFYVLMFLFSFLYINHRRVWHLAVLQLLSVFVISFRMSYLLVVQISAICLPLIAFLPELRAAVRKRSFGLLKPPGLQLAALHLVVSILLIFVLHQGYRQLNGRLGHRGPAYLQASGFSILSTWAPLLQPSDSPDPRLARLIEEGSQFQLSDMRMRDPQLYARGYLISRWRQIEPNPTIANQVAAQTALHALLRNPMGVAVLGAKTFLAYWDFKEIRRQANVELGKAKPQHNWSENMTSTFAEKFRLAPPPAGDAKSYTLLQRYYLIARPYYYIVLLSPVVCGVVIFFVAKGYVLLVLLHSWLIFGTVTILSKAASVRYMQPMSLLTIVIFAILVKAVIDRRSQPTATSA